MNNTITFEVQLKDDPFYTLHLIDTPTEEEDNKND